MMRSVYLHRRFFIGLWGMILLFLLSFLWPALMAWACWCLCLFAVLLVTDLCLLYATGGTVKALRRTAGKYSNGEDNPVEISIENNFSFRIKVRVLDEVPVEFQKRDLCLHYGLVSGETAVRTYLLHPVRRGVYRFGRLRVFVSTPISFVERCQSFDSGCEIAVYPSFLMMKKYELLALAGSRLGNGVLKRRSADISTSFDQIKFYVPGDDSRAVNWKATAKCNRLMVNSYTEERSQQVYCLLDKGRAMQSPFEGMTMLDYAINAILALSCVVLKKDDKAGLLTFSCKTETLIKADSRRLQLNAINEALYNQQTDFLESDFDQLCMTVSRQIPSRSLLVLFTNFDTLAGMRRRLPALLRLAKTHLLLVILFENTEINQALHIAPSTMEDIYFKTIVGSFISEKRRIAAELRKTGIYTVLTEPKNLTANSVNAYLELKERGLL